MEDAFTDNALQINSYRPSKKPFIVIHLNCLFQMHMYGLNQFRDSLLVNVKVNSYWYQIKEKKKMMKG